MLKHLDHKSEHNGSQSNGYVCIYVCILNGRGNTEFANLKWCTWGGAWVPTYWRGLSLCGCVLTESLRSRVNSWVSGLYLNGPGAWPKAQCARVNRVCPKPDPNVPGPDVLNGSTRLCFEKWCYPRLLEPLLRHFTIIYPINNSIFLHMKT